MKTDREEPHGCDDGLIYKFPSDHKVREGKKTPKCEHCGAELKGDEAFCPRCGASVAAARPPAPPRPPEEEFRRVREKGCFGGGGLWGAISGGVFIIGLGLLWYLSSIGVEWAWWPGILFLVGIMIILGGLISYARK